MNKHIPGPWTLNVDLKFPRVATIVGPQGKDIEIIAAISNETEMATLRLIAAAPDLLSAIKNARHFIDELAEEFPSHPDKFNGTWASYRDEFDAVIAKAEGA